MRCPGNIQSGDDRGTILALARYNIMGPVKAALEAVVRHMAVELDPKFFF